MHRSPHEPRLDWRGFSARRAFVLAPVPCAHYDCGCSLHGFIVRRQRPQTDVDFRIITHPRGDCCRGGDAGGGRSPPHRPRRMGPRPPPSSAASPALPLARPSPSQQAQEEEVLLQRLPAALWPGRLRSLFQPGLQPGAGVVCYPAQRLCYNNNGSVRRTGPAGSMATDRRTMMNILTIAPPPPRRPRSSASPPSPARPRPPTTSASTRPGRRRSRTSRACSPRSSMR